MDRETINREIKENDCRLRLESLSDLGKAYYAGVRDVLLAIRDNDLDRLSIARSDVVINYSPSSELPGPIHAFSKSATDSSAM